MLRPLTRNFYGGVIEQDTSLGLRLDLQDAIEHLGKEISAYGEDRRLIAMLESPQKKLFQVRVLAVGPDCVDVKLGDIVILHPGAGTMVTVYDEDTEQMERLFLASEKDALATWREE